MATFGVSLFGVGSEGEEIGGGVAIIINGIADTFGLPGMKGPGAFGVVGEVVNGITVMGVGTGANGPVPVPLPDQVQQNMAATDP